MSLIQECEFPTSGYCLHPKLKSLYQRRWQFMISESKKKVQISCSNPKETFAGFTVERTTRNIEAKGECRQKKSSELFTVSLSALAVIGVVIMLGGSIFKQDIVKVLCSDSSLHSYMIEYLEIYLLLFPIFFVFCGLAYFCRVDNFPNLASLSVIVANAINVVLDYVYIEWFDMGIGGAALASLSGYIIGILLYVFYFRSQERTLHFNLKGLRIGSLRLLGTYIGKDTIWWALAIAEGGTVIFILVLSHAISLHSKGRYSSVFLFDKETAAATLDLTLTTHPSDIEACRLLITEFMRRSSNMPTLLNGVPSLFVQEAKMFGFSEPTSIDVVIRKDEETVTIRFRHYAKRNQKRSSLQKCTDMKVLTYTNQQILNINVITYIVK